LEKRNLGLPDELKKDWAEIVDCMTAEKLKI